MKHCTIALFLFLAVITVHAKAIQEDIKLEDEKSRTSYAFGMSVGSGLKQAELELDYDAFLEGLRKTMEDGQTLMDQDEALELMQAAFEISMKKQNERLRAKEENFLAENALNDAVITNPSGLQYMILVKGEGPKPAADDIVRVHYEGTLVDGTVFDSSYHSEKGEEIPLDMVIPGWAEGLLLMNVGSKYRIYIPSNLAYGENGAGQVIPPYATLIFTIELLEIVKDDRGAGAEDSEQETESNEQ
jgi:FKBP-type peptidyl-prolyl cis-trans isomerase